MSTTGFQLSNSALLALADGTLFWGASVGVDGVSVGEVVFNTAMSGYQEILTDPSYCRQLVTLTYPHIGNTGTNAADAESASVMAAGLIVRDVPAAPSNWRSEQSLPDYLQQQGVVAIQGIDTRKLTRILRERGAQSGCLVAGANIDAQAAIQKARDFPGLQGMDLAAVVTTAESYTWTQGSWRDDEGLPAARDWQDDFFKFHVVAYDFGVKRNILRLLVDRGCRVTAVPATTTAEQVLQLQPDGVFLSNGPGDPQPCEYAIEAIAQLCEQRIPLFGICLGHQLLSIASGAKSVKMKFGHHGANHPVQVLDTRRVMVTSQNHGFAIDEQSLPENLVATHRSLFDQSLQGVARVDCPAFGFQGHPEASPGPHDIAPLFDDFVALMQVHRGDEG